MTKKLETPQIECPTGHMATVRCTNQASLKRYILVGASEMQTEPDF